MADSSIKTTETIADGLALQDIELPTPPGVDWDFWLAVFGWSLLALVLIVALLLLGRRYYAPVQSSWQLQRLQKAALAEDGATIGKEQLWQLYGWSRRLQGRIPRSKAEAEEMTAFTERLNRLGFSQQDVSRETYRELIQQAQTLLRNRSVLKLNRPVQSEIREEGP